MNADPHYYVRQKVWQALGCLVGPGTLGERLTMAASVLSELKVQPALVARLPGDVLEKLERVLNALTRREPLEGPHDSGAAAAVRRLTDAEREQIATVILDIYVGLKGGV
jgi:NaMN:DMB phosphoribosyltransferase